MPYLGWTITIKPEMVSAYVERHQDVWPEMQQAITAAGFRNSRMFISDNQVFGYAEADDVEAAQRRLARTEVNRRWQEHMADCFEAMIDADGPRQLTPVFALD